MTQLPPPGELSTGGKTILNVLWLVLAGIWLAIGYFIAGVVSCVFIITIPFGIQSFKLAGYSLWPFNRTVVDRPGRDVALGCLGNLLWFILGGWWMALAHLLTGILLCLTIIGIPLGIANFKLAGLALAPFGKMIVSTATARAMLPPLMSTHHVVISAEQIPPPPFPPPPPLPPNWSPP